jgi:hypothetical protein
LALAHTCVIYFAGFTHSVQQGVSWDRLVRISTRLLAWAWEIVVYFLPNARIFLYFELFRRAFGLTYTPI